MPNPSAPRFAVLLAAFSSLLFLAPAYAHQKRATVRVTTGTVVTSGWETALVRGNPNLHHWHWDPIYSNVTGLQTRVPCSGPNKVASVPPGKFIPAAAPRRSVYERPIHLPMNMEHKKPSNPVITLFDQGARRSKPAVIAVLTQKKVDASLSQNKVSGVLGHEHVQALLADRQAAGTFLPKPAVEAPESASEPSAPQIATYHNSYRPPQDDFDCLTDSGSKVERSTVSAKLAHPAASHPKKKSSRSKQHPDISF